MKEKRRVMGKEVFERLTEVYEDAIEQNETVEQFGHRFDAEPSTFVSVPKGMCMREYVALRRKNRENS